MKPEQTQEELAAEAQQREGRDRMYDDAVNENEPKIESEIETDMQRERDELQGLANKQEDPNWQLKEVIEMVSLELKSLLDQNPEKKKEIGDLIVEIRKRITDLQK